MNPYLVKSIALLTACALIFSCAPQKQEVQRFNIMFFLTDDQRFSLINALGIENVITPTMDSFVNNGVNFKNTYVMPFSHAPCLPSRAMILSGRDAFSIVDSGKKIPHKMIQETLQDERYTTFLTGKWHNGLESARGFSVAKNVFFGGMSNQYTTKVTHLKPDGTWSDQTKKKNQHSSELFSDSAIEFLESQRNVKAPFFAYISYKAPHDPRECPQQYMDMYNLPNGDPDPTKVKLPPNFATMHPSEEEYFDNGDLTIRDEKLASRPRVASEVLRHIRDYYAITTHLDAQIGRVMAKLDEIGKTENTIIIFAGDNGLAVGQHALMGKQNLYRHSAAVPLVISGKGIPKGISVESLCYLFDIYPTICDLVKSPIPSSVKGMSLVPMLKDQTHGNRESIYLPFKESQRAVRKKRYKLIEYNVKGIRTTQLFDMLQDPWEKNNLASNPAYAEKLSELKTEIVRLKKIYSDNGSFWDGY